MIYTEKIKDSIAFSIKTHEIHQKQKRKGKDVSYITHPLTVGLILSQAGASEDVVIAGILHDTIEDSVAEKKVTKDMLAERFGDNVAMLVDSVSEKDGDLSWHERKSDALEEIKKFSNDSLFVKSADVLSNNTELIDDHGQDGEVTFDRFGGTKEETLGHALKVIEVILSKWQDNPLRPDLEQLSGNLGKMLNGNYDYK